MQTRESEFTRVVRHEAGHTLGFPHEHLRKALVDKIIPSKAFSYYKATQGWSPQEVRSQVLTPIEEAVLRGTPVDYNSIMCYQIPGSITRDGNPIAGGVDINAQDHAFAAQVYPRDNRARSRAEAALARPLSRGALARPLSRGALARRGRADYVGAGGTAGAPVLCFAPGTDPGYIAAVVEALRGSRSAL
jgi:hypothetical protein